jgi:hypothetical protein
MGDIVIWAILVMLWVPLWLCAIAILVLVLRNATVACANEPFTSRCGCGWTRGPLAAWPWAMGA